MKKEAEEKLFRDIVLRFARESHCESKKVAALAVKNGRIIATGINGTPKGLMNCDDYFRRRYKNNVKGFEKLSYEDWLKTSRWRREHREWSEKNEIHAEQNLIVEACKNGISLEGVDIYLSMEPCIHCTKLLAALGPNCVYYVNEYDKADEYSRKLLKESGIKFKQVKH